MDDFDRDAVIYRAVRVMRHKGAQDSIEQMTHGPVRDFLVLARQWAAHTGTGSHPLDLLVSQPLESNSFNLDHKPRR